MNSKLKKKLVDEQALSAAEALELDQALDSPSLSRALMSKLTDDEPSLAWRSSLNQSLIKASGAKAASKVLKWGSGIVVTAAAALGIIALLPRPVVEPNRVLVKSQPVMSNIEESLVSAHKEADLESGLGVSLSQGSTDAPSSDSL
ncbi:MAG: hypothetical protein JSS66_03595 [Armatimonadetes bacterium]|nr:hypothetical protein [Armatimonadota bacterium]